MKKVIILVLLLSLGSCKKRELPAGILSKNKMIRILIDVHIAEGKVGQLGLKSSDSSSVVFRMLQDSIFKKNKVTQERYASSYKYYRENPELMDEIYAQIVDSLSLRQKVLKLN